MQITVGDILSVPGKFRIQITEVKATSIKGLDLTRVDEEGRHPIVEVHLEFWEVSS